jgi:hypothetical protein
MNRERIIIAILGIRLPQRERRSQLVKVGSNEE